jgi:PhnB protein
MNFKPKNVPQLSPYMTVVDADESINFYEKAFGFVASEVVKDDNGKAQHVSMRKDDIIIMFCPEGSYGSTKKSPKTHGIEMPINMYVYCQDADSLYKQAISNGAKSLIEPHDSFWGDRFCSVLCIDNYEWSFATLLKK